MIDQTSIILFFTLIATFFFSFTYWRDATREGYSSDQIFDSIVYIMIGSLLGGKILFRNINYDYFRYQFLSSPLILEGVLLGGGLAVYFTVKKHKWDGWKIGDMIAPALTLFQAIIFLGLAVATTFNAFVVISLALFALYLFLQFLKYKKFLGTSVSFFQNRRMNKPVFTGGLIATYLTGSSTVAILFLLPYSNIESWFWWFQIIFYLVISIVSLFLIKGQLNKQNFYMAPGFNNNFLGKMKNALLGRKAEVEKEMKSTNKNDPYIKENLTTDVEDLGDHAADIMEHETIQAEETVLKQELSDIDESLKDMNKGIYGISKKTGKSIPEDRLKANPTAKSNVNE